MIISNTDNSYSKVLATLLENQSWQSPLHTQSALNYYRQRPEDEEKTIQYQSFILVWENESVVGYNILIVEDVFSKKIQFNDN